MPRTIRVMALLALAMHLILGVSLYGQSVTRFASGPYYFPYTAASSVLFSALLYVLYVTSYLLAFALGVVTVVAAVQQRRRRWFIPLLPLTVLVGYLSVIPQIIEDIIYVFSQLANPGQIPLERTQPSFVVYIPLIILGLPAALALTALAYTARGRAWATAQTGAPSDREEAEDQLEVSSIDLPLDGTR